MLAVDVAGVEVRYGRIVALEDVTLRVPHPSICVVLGPNGAGKTTLLRTLLGLVKPVRGSVKVLGVDVLREPARVRGLAGYVPQIEYINDEVPIRAYDVILYARLAKFGRTRPSEEDIDVVEEMLRLVQVPRESWFRPFNELSRGQQQKVLIARALALEPKILLLDEPFAAVDVPSQCEIAEFLRHLRDKHEVSVLVVAHEMLHLAKIVDYVALLNRRLIAFGEPRVALTPENLEKCYGVPLHVVEVEEFCVPLIGDRHFR